MIISRTPFRVSFFGGGSDLPAYYVMEKGAVLSTTINKYMYISIHPFFNRKQIQLKYSKTELVDGVEKIKHPIIKQCLISQGVQGGVEVTSTADIPAGTGLGSSSAFTVAMLHTLFAFKGKFVSKQLLAEKACEIEIEKLKEPIGKQDQYAAAYGGLNVFEFQPDGSVDTQPINLKGDTVKQLEDNLIMFYTKTQRKANEILKDQSSQIKKPEKIGIQAKMVSQVYEGRDHLYNGDLTSFGQLLGRAWEMKKKLSRLISDESIERHYRKALKAGALGGKLLGAGGGGFLLFYCEPERQNKVRKALSDLYELEFNFDRQGSKIIHVGEKDWGDVNGFFE